MINYKHDAFEFGTAVVDIERGQFADAKPYLWQTDTAVAKNSWCYTEENVYKSSVQILQDLVDIVSKNGRMMLNIGPKADGTIPEEDKRILLEIGDWLRTNGKAIYGAKLWRFQRWQALWRVLWEFICSISRMLVKIARGAACCGVRMKTEGAACRSFLHNKTMSIIFQLLHRIILYFQQ